MKGVRIWTLVYNPFNFGPVNTPTATEIDEYERIAIGKGYYGLLVYNRIKNLWHLAEEISGAIIGTNKSKTRLVNRVKIDVKSGDIELMKQQVTEGKDTGKYAKTVSQEEFFKKFSTK
jgi:hypothetical protein